MRTRLLAAVASLALVAAGCSGGGHGQVNGVAAGSSTSTTAAGGSTGPGVSQRTPTSRVGGSNGGTSATTAAGGSTPTTRAGGGTGTTSPAPAGDPNGPPGAFARTVLRPSPATTVVVERLEQSGAGPRQTTIDHVVSVLQREASKQVKTSGPIAVPGSGQDWTAEQLTATADRLGQATQGGSQAVIRLLFVHGTFEGNGQVLGVSVRGDVAAIFTDQVVASATPIIGRPSIERAVVTHELGHLLGLVDLVLKTGRQDPDHPGHSTNQASVMYWAVESSLVTQVLTGGPPDDFDSQDRADLAAMRGGA